MAPVVQLEDVQTWLETTKLTLPEQDLHLADSFQAEVFAAVASAYNTSSWTSVNTTPVLVRKVIAMMVAGTYWMRQYSEMASEPNSYGLWLLSRADTLLQGIISGSLSLVEVPGATAGDPAFWPNDTTGSSEVYDAQGNLLAVAGSEDIKFTMGFRF